MKKDIFKVKVGDKVSIFNVRGEDPKRAWEVAQIGSTDCTSFMEYKKYMSRLSGEKYADEDLSDAIVLLVDGKSENEALLKDLKLL